MAYKRVLTIQDISCVGQCSMTVALPVLSACGLETCILPTAILSTHTGGFGKPHVVHLSDAIAPTVRHWQDNGITFDAILVGYLGSIAAVEAVSEVLNTMLAPGGVSIVDPAMADHGKRYSGLDEAYAQAIKALCTQADIVIPNLTEAAMMGNCPYNGDNNGCYVSKSYVKQILSALPFRRVILTGVGYAESTTGASVWEDGVLAHCSHPKLSGSYHGTGDLFAAAFTGAYIQGKNLLEAAKIAGNFTYRCIKNTQNAPAHWYGVKFETALPDLMEMLKN